MKKYYYEKFQDTLDDLDNLIYTSLNSEKVDFEYYKDSGKDRVEKHKENIDILKEIKLLKEEFEDKISELHNTRG